MIIDCDFSETTLSHITLFVSAVRSQVHNYILTIHSRNTNRHALWFLSILSNPRQHASSSTKYQQSILAAHLIFLQSPPMDMQTVTVVALTLT